MKAARIHIFGGPQVIVIEDVPIPVPASGEVLVGVAATGVGTWDALIREGKSQVSPSPPLTVLAIPSFNYSVHSFLMRCFRSGNELNHPM